MQKRAINLRLEEDLVAAVDHLAQATGTDRTELIARGLRRELLYDGQREFIYVLLDADRHVRYVGRARDPYKRLREHVAGARAGGSSAKERWLSEMLAAGSFPQLAIIDDAAGGDDIQELEALWIDHFKSDTLTNGILYGARAGVAPGPRKQSGSTMVRIPDELRDKIDAVRGDVPRERWVRRQLETLFSVPNSKPTLRERADKAAEDQAWVQRTEEKR